MFKIIVVNFSLIPQPSSANNLPSPHDNYTLGFFERINQDQFNVLPVSQCDCKGCLDVRSLSHNRVVDYSENPYDVANKEARVILELRAKPMTFT